MIVILVLVQALVALGWAGRCKLPTEISACGTNSLAIAAACHHEGPEEEEVVCRPLMWGVTKEATMDTPGHCSMSNQDVGRPVEGMTYT